MLALIVFTFLATACRWYPRSPDFVIGDNYLARWWVIPRNSVFNVYLHCISKNDDDRALHDHPWWNVSVILKGAYREVMPDGDRILRRGRIAFRRSTALHRLEVVDGPVWSLFITGPRVREWGFACPQGWVHWKAFTSADGRNVGKGCDQ
jgi:hypothetical protein